MSNEAMRVSNLILCADEDGVAHRASIDDLASAAHAIDSRDADQGAEWKEFDVVARGTKNKSDKKNFYFQSLLVHTRHIEPGIHKERSIAAGRFSSPQLDNPTHSAPTRRQLHAPFTKHFTNPATQKNFKCSICPSYFKNAAGLSHHQRAHVEARVSSSLVNRPPTNKATTANLFLCEFCPASYSHFGYLMRHREIHFD
ncbi:hypothetical protein BC830DRAFT_61504 [Chytriomyces sp. MP71]|nr:hypothetical protein BC830DRAFT_61504 [Chytriomyces sp. MP71]